MAPTLKLSLADLALSPVVVPAAWLLGWIRRVGLHKMPRCRRALLRVGVLPIRDHYYEPLFDMRHLKRDCDDARPLPGIDWNVAEQLEFCQGLEFAAELDNLPRHKTDELSFYLDNGSFESGDAEYWYQLIRRVKPRRIIEIGSGNSTLMAIRATSKNSSEDPSYRCEHTCVEPYEMPWLEQTGVTVLRKKVEDLDVSFFGDLNANDILFIDSSHMVRPEGDVLYEFLELLPTLKPGVIVHVHDIFSPANYPAEWLHNQIRLWNEQYLLEAFLCHNQDWKILGALNYLQREHHQALKKICPFLTPERRLGSFYIQRCS